MLDAWREQGVDRLDPVRFRFIEAMARRAAGHDGNVQRVLENRLAALLKAFADDLERAASKGGDAHNATSNCANPCGELAGLVDYIASRAPARDDRFANKNAASSSASYPELSVLDDFREIWSRISTHKQLRQSLEQVPGNAGPLNSSSLVHRSLSLMHELSPGYLQQFLSYVDALSWMEQLNAGAPAGKQPPRAGNTVDAARKPRRNH